MLINIVGQDSLKKYWRNIQNDDSYSAGYIIEGPKYMGKEFIAEQLAEEKTESYYIQKLLPTNDRKNVAVEDMREMINDCYVKTYNSKTKVFIIPNAETLNTACQNAFLKTLEEPPINCMFLLLVEDSQYLLETIKSRCVALKLKPYSREEIVTYLMSKGITPNDLLLVLTEGCLNKYEVMIEKNFIEMRELVYKVFENIMEMHPARLFSIIKHVEKLENTQEDFFLMCSLILKDLFLIYGGLESQCQLNLPTSIIRAFANKSVSQIGQCINLMDSVRSRLYLNCNISMLLINVLMQLQGGE